MMWYKVGTGAAVAWQKEGGRRCSSHSPWFPEPRSRLSAILILVIPSSSSPSTYCLCSDFLPVPPALAAPTSCLPWSGCPESPKSPSK